MPTIKPKRVIKPKPPKAKTTAPAPKPEGEKRPDPLPALSSTSAVAPSAARTSTAPTSVLSGVSLSPSSFRNKPPHVVVRARAGTGKTTTLIEGLKLLKGLPTSITPSPQQRAVWDALLQSKDRCRFTAFVAFNSSIAAELKDRVPPGVDAKTMHGLGFGAVRRSFPNPVPRVDENRVRKLVAELVGRTVEELHADWDVELRAVEELVGLCKMNLLDGTPRDLDELCDRHDVSFGDRDGSAGPGDFERAERRREEVFALVPRVLQRCRDVRKDNSIDYDDMVWLPVVLKLNVFRFDVLLVDEAQDLNRCQQELAKRAGERLIFVGDDRQAIYGFAGADSESLPRLAKELNDDLINPPLSQRGCVVLPLTVTRRCGRAIVAEANRYVPDFEAHESNPDGLVRTASYPVQRDKKLPDDQTYLPLVKEGDMVLCRANAPLVAQYFKLIRRGVRAYVQGRKDVGAKIASLVTKMKVTTVPDLIKEVGFWLERSLAKENARSEPRDAKLAQFQDLHDCVLAFAEDADTIPAVLANIDRVFADTTRPGVRLSSVHKAKGLEADRVFFLAPGGFRGRHSRQKDWEWEQELNLRYVGVTRAIRELTYVF